MFLSLNHHLLGGGFKYWKYFIPTCGRFPFWIYVFQLGWRVTHQVVWPRLRDFMTFPGKPLRLAAIGHLFNTPGVLWEEWLRATFHYLNLLMFQKNAQNVHKYSLDHDFTPQLHTCQPALISFKIQKNRNSHRPWHDPSSMVGSCWCWSRSSSLDNKNLKWDFQSDEVWWFIKAHLICLFHPILGEIFHFYWYVGKPMIVLVLFLFNEFERGYVIFTLLETITYLAPALLTRWFSGFFRVG